MKAIQLIGVSAVSTGREGYDTPPGEFRIMEKDREHVSSLYGNYVDQSGQVVMENVEANKDPEPRGTIFRGAAMPYFLRIHGAIGMHAGYLPGYPASHGCIRLPEKMALQFFQNAAVGTPVEIRHALAPNYVLRSIVSLDVFLPPGCEARRGEPLTARQREVLQLLAEGRSMKEVADLLHVTARTVAFHKYTIMEHLGLKTSAELVQYAVEYGMVKKRS